MKRLERVFPCVLTVLLGVCLVGLWQPSVAGEATETSTERVTRLNPTLMPLTEPGPQEFSLEAFSNAPYTVIDLTVSENLTQVHDTQILVFNDKLVIVYSDGIPNRQVKLWYDDGRGGGTAGDALANGSEVRVVDALQLFFVFDTAAVSVREVNGLLAVTYSSISPSNQPEAPDDLKLWYDDGRGGGIAGDAVVNGDELRTLATGFQAGGELLERNGQLLVVWKDSFLLRLWADDGAGGGTAGDGLINGSERRTLDLPFNPEVGMGRFMTNVGGDLAVAYWEFTGVNPDLRVWVDDGAGIGGVADDLVVNGTENHAIAAFTRKQDWWTSVAWVDGLLAVSFKIQGADFDLFLWYDDGGTANDGTAGDLIFSGTEARQLLHDGNVGEFSDIAQLGGRIAVITQFVNPPQLKLFYDDGNDGAVADDAAAFGVAPGQIDPLEARGIDQPLAGGGFGASVTVYNPDPGDPSVCDHLAVAHINQCDTACGYPDNLALHLTTVNALAPRGLFIHDTGDHQIHDPVALQEDIDLTLRWFQDGADEGEIFISGDVTGPNVGVWLTMVENIVAFSDFMTVPVSLIPGDGGKTIFMSFRTGICAGTNTVRTLTLGVAVPDPTNLAMLPGGAGQAVLDWDESLDPVVDGYNVYRAAGAPTTWTLLTPSPLASTVSSFTDTGAALGVDGIFYYFVTSVDSLGNESSDPPN